MPPVRISDRLLSSSCTNRHLRHLWDQTAHQRHAQRVKTMKPAINDRLEPKFWAKRLNIRAEHERMRREREIADANGKVGWNWTPRRSIMAAQFVHSARQIVRKLESIANRPELTISAPPAVCSLKGSSNNVSKITRTILVQNEVRQASAKRLRRIH